MQKRDLGGIQHRTVHWRIIPQCTTRRLQLESLWKNGSPYTIRIRVNEAFLIARRLRKQFPNSAIEIQTLNLVPIRAQKSFFVRINFATSRKLLYVTTIPKRLLYTKSNWLPFWVQFNRRSQSSRI